MPKSSALAPYYPLMVACGIISNIVIGRLLTEHRVERLAMLHHDVKVSSQPAAS